MKDMTVITAITCHRVLTYATTYYVYPKTIKFILILNFVIYIFERIIHVLNALDMLLNALPVVPLA